MKNSLGAKLLSLLGIEIQYFQGEESIQKVFAEIKREQRLKEVRDLLPLLQPGTELAIDIDVPLTKPVRIHYFCEEKQVREEVLRLARAQ